MKIRRITLSEQEIPEYWYNVRADMPNAAPPLLNSKTKQPIGTKELQAFFPDEIIRHMTTTERWVKIPDKVRDMYSMWRPTPLHRAYELERVLDTPAKIYYKNEAGSLTGSHKLNAAIPQAYEHKVVGSKRVVSEVATGQWGSSVCFAANHFGMQADTFILKLSHLREQYDSIIMKLWGGEVTVSPSRTTSSGRRFYNDKPFTTGVLGVAISESIETVLNDVPNAGYIMGTALGHVDLYNSVIGLEMIKQFEKIDETPDVVISAFGGGTAFAGMSYPMMHWAKERQKDIRFVAVEATACPVLTRGEYRYDYLDASGYLPLAPMYTLGSRYEAPPIFAGNMRYHGSSVVGSQLLQDKQFEAIAISNQTAMEGAYQMTAAEGIIVSYSSTYAVGAAIQEALKCKESGEAKNIVFCLDGIGTTSLAGATSVLSSTFQLLDSEEEKIQESLAALDTPLVKR